MFAYAGAELFVIMQKMRKGGRTLPGGVRQALVTWQLLFCNLTHVDSLSSACCSMVAVILDRANFLKPRLHHLLEFVRFMVIHFGELCPLCL